MKKLSDEQEKAVSEMNKAIQGLKKSGIVIFGMDNDLLYVSKDAIKDATKNDNKIGKNYNPAADTYHAIEGKKDYRCGSFRTKNVYIDSGGW